MKTNTEIVQSLLSTKGIILVFIIALLTVSNSCGGEKASRDEEILAAAFFLSQEKGGIYEEGEEYSGGDTTNFDVTGNAFDLPAANLTDVDRTIEFFEGNSFFNIDWVPPINSAQKGLGPFFSVNSCNACHSKDGRGRPPENTGDSDGDKLISMLIRFSKPGVDSVTGGPNPLANYGTQLDHQDLFNGANSKPEGSVTIEYEEIAGTFPDGESYSLRKPTYKMNWNYDAPDEYMISPRTAPFIIGLGLVSAIPEETILEYADPDDEDGDGISGKANRVWSHINEKGGYLGRFGWKANVPFLSEQNQGAFLGDIGITSPLFPDENCTIPDGTHPSGMDCSDLKLNVHTSKSPEVNEKTVELVNFYTHLINVPGRRGAKNATVLQGKKLFFDIGCVQCHRQKYVTGELENFPELENQTIYPYSDFLLHDLGDDLADNRPEFEATGNEWRTPPLWGTGLIKRVNGHELFLHDGRARGQKEAILWHGGEAQTVKEKFMNLSADDRDALITFLQSL